MYWLVVFWSINVIRYRHRNNNNYLMHTLISHIKFLCFRDIQTETEKKKSSKYQRYAIGATYALKVHSLIFFGSSFDSDT